MTKKILVADDSLTIQKVISITLGNWGPPPIECLNEVDLFSKLKRGGIGLLLLDFNLSENKDGLTLIKEISSLYPSLPIVALLGTFDSVDEEAIIKAGAKDKLVKPFDGPKFVQLCKTLLQNDESSIDQEIIAGEIELNSDIDDTEAVIENGDNEIEDENDGWGVESSSQKIDPKIQNQKKIHQQMVSTPTGKTKTALAEEIEGWGMEVPNSSGVLLPPKLEVIQNNSELNKNEDTVQYPKNDDLDFPVETEKTTFKADDFDIKNVKLSTKLVPIDDLVHDDSADTDSNERFDKTSEINLSLEKEVNEQMSSDDFWAPDEELSHHSDEKSDINELPNMSSFAVTEDMVEKMKEALAPMLDKLVRDYCKKTIEQVAWEVIPDLAENLIKKEINEISQSLK